MAAAPASLDGKRERSMEMRRHMPRGPGIGGLRTSGRQDKEPRRAAELSNPSGSVVRNRSSQECPNNCAGETNTRGGSARA